MTLRTGGCLCEAVRFTVEIEQPNASVCWCTICQKWNGGPAVTVAVRGDKVVYKVENDALQFFFSTDFGERGFCKNCGAALLWRANDRSITTIGAGFFDDQSDFVLTDEIYCDAKPTFLSFAGNHPRLSNEETLAAFVASTTGATSPSGATREDDG